MERLRAEFNHPKVAALGRRKRPSLPEDSRNPKQFALLIADHEVGSLTSRLLGNPGSFQIERGEGPHPKAGNLPYVEQGASGGGDRSLFRFDASHYERRLRFGARPSREAPGQPRHIARLEQRKELFAKTVS